MTAIEYLFEELLKLESQYYLGTIGRIDFRKKRLELLEQAKEMEKQQMFKALIKGADVNGAYDIELEFKEYYNDTFKNIEQ